MAKPHLVIIGNGMAGGRLLEEILKRDPARYRITVFGAERWDNYNRIMLSPVLAGEIEKPEIILHTREWYTQQGIELHSGDPVVYVDTAQQQVISQQGLTVHYDKLVLATGSEATLPANLPGENTQGIFSFRKMDDIDAILSAGQHSRRAIVLGGGLLGLEAAYGLSKQNIPVTVIHRGPWLLNRQLDPKAAELLRQELELRGIEIRLNCEIQDYICTATDTGNVLSAVQMADGTLLNCDLAVIAIGITPNTELARSSELNCQRGIVINSLLETNADPVYALGECSEFEGETFGLVAPIWDQAQALADRLCYTADSHFELSPYATKLKVSGIDLFSAGEYLDQEDTESLVYEDPEHSVYRKLIFRGQTLVGTVLYGAVQDGQWYFDLIQANTDIRHLAPMMLFGKQYCKALLAEQPSSNTAVEAEPHTEFVSDTLLPPGATPISASELASGVTP